MGRLPSSIAGGPRRVIATAAPQGARAVMDEMEIPTVRPHAILIEVQLTRVTRLARAAVAASQACIARPPLLAASAGVSESEPDSALVSSAEGGAVER